MYTKYIVYSMYIDVFTYVCVYISANICISILIN